MSSGIYEILNTVNGHRYIGSAVNLTKRLNNHKSMLSRGEHTNKYLQNAYNKYGIDNFKFTILLYCEKEELIKNEQYYIDKFDFEELYNIRKKAESNLGIIVSEDTRKRLSVVGKNRKHTEETKQRISKSNKGKVISVAQREKISKANSNPTDITRKKMSASQKGKKVTQATKDKMSSTRKLEENGNAKLKSADVIKIKQMLVSKKFTYQEIADKFCVSKGAIADIKKFKRWEFVGSEYNNELQNISYNSAYENNGMAKLTNNDVVKIKQILVSQKSTIQKIANKFNVSRETIRNIKILKSWVTIGEEYNNDLRKL